MTNVFPQFDSNVTNFIPLQVTKTWKMATVKFAVIDVTDFLSKKQTTEPDLAADWAKLEELYNKK